MSTGFPVGNKYTTYINLVVKCHVLLDDERGSRESLLSHDRARRNKKGFNQEGNLRPTGSVEVTPRLCRGKAPPFEPKVGAGCRALPCGINTLYWRGGK